MLLFYCTSGRGTRARQIFCLVGTGRKLSSLTNFRSREQRCTLKEVRKCRTTTPVPVLDFVLSSARYFHGCFKTCFYRFFFFSQKGEKNGKMATIFVSATIKIRLEPFYFGSCWCCLCCFCSCKSAIKLSIFMIIDLKDLGCVHNSRVIYEKKNESEATGLLFVSVSSSKVDWRVHGYL